MGGLRNTHGEDEHWIQNFS